MPACPQRSVFADVADPPAFDIDLVELGYRVHMTAISWRWMLFLPRKKVSRTRHKGAYTLGTERWNESRKKKKIRKAKKKKN